jgi:hypothetical protein
MSFRSRGGGRQLSYLTFASPDFLNKHGVDEEGFNNEIWDLLMKF